MVKKGNLCIYIMIVFKRFLQIPKNKLEKKIITKSKYGFKFTYDISISTKKKILTLFKYSS